jgi:ABC-2 type transport system permease protein
VTSPAAVRPRPSTPVQWWVLTVRVIAPSLRNGELATGVAATVVFAAGFYLPLHDLMGTATMGISSSYAQYIMPMITLQAVSFAAISAAFRSANDSVEGINRRFGSMPVAPWAPMAARMSASVCRCTFALAVAVICGYFIGFRFHRGAEFTVGYCLLAIVIGAVLSFGADLLGTGSKNPEAMTPLLTLPQVMFGLLSVGVQPAEQFPEWIQPFVLNQPISQFVNALRALAGDSTATALPVTWSVMSPTLAWLLGLTVVFLPLSTIVLSRRP